MNQKALVIKRALVSVSDKTGIIDLCKFLHHQGVELISTGGTAKTLSENGIPHRPIETVTGNPEAFGGRMKTISFQVGSALLYRRDHEVDQQEAKKLKIEAIDLVICNLYPFEKTAKENRPLPELIENIDIGGPTMVRAAAKNYAHVACVTSPNDYRLIQNEIEKTGEISFLTREQLALKTFSVIAAYDLSIAVELTKRLATHDSSHASMSTSSGTALRYGENPHQKAAILKFNNTDTQTPLAQATFLQGKELSYNNLLDSDQAFKCASELNQLVESRKSKNTVCVIVKHGVPCGVAEHADSLKALEIAWNADSISAFGSIICFNCEITAPMAAWLKERFVEVIIAPKYSAEALTLFSAKKNLRLLEVPLKKSSDTEWTIRSINGGILCQDEDQGISNEMRLVTKKEFPSELSPVMQFGLVVTKFLKSNCIGIFGIKENGFTVISSGVGQPNRLDCITLLAGVRAKAKNENLKDAVLVSDAFFPFKDSIEAAHEIGIQYIVQPGGSVRDNEVIQTCDEFGMAMSFTGKRHFRH